MTRHPTLVRFIPLVFVLLWSTGFIAAKFALPFVEPFTLLLIRMLITLVLFLVLIIWLKAPRLSLSDAAHQMVVGSLIHAGYLGGVFAAIKLQMPAGIASLVVGLQPILTAILSILLLAGQLRGRQWLGLILGFAGVTLVLLQRDLSAAQSFDWRALVAAIVALFSISIGTLYQKHFGGRSHLLTGSFYQYLATAIWMAGLSFMFESQHVVWSMQLIIALIWLVVVLSIFAILLLMVMIREGEASKVASYFYLVPPVTAIEGWLLFDERLNMFALFGIGLAVVGVYLVVRSQRR